MMITHISVFIPYYKCGFCMFLGGCVSFWGERAEFLPNKDLGILIIHCGTPHESTPTRDFPRAFWHCSVDHVPPFWTESRFNSFQLVQNGVFPKFHFLLIFWSFKHITILGYRVGIHQGFSRFFQPDLHFFLHSGEGFELREAGLCDAEGEPGHHFSAGGVV